MPPKQCPNCRRFLKNALVDALAEGPQPCPGCEEPLSTDLLGGEEVAVNATVEHEGGSGKKSTSVGEGSVRPPDLAPGDVRDDASDVLDGWDRGADAAEIAAWNDDQPPFPTDTVVVAGSGLVGALFGAMVAHRRIRGALLGGVAGVLLAAIVRRIWRLPD